MDRNPKQFVNKNENNESVFSSNREDNGADEDDPLSIKDTSLTILGLILAVITVLLPSICVLLERPSLQDNEKSNKEMLKKDGY